MTTLTGPVRTFAKTALTETFELALTETIKFIEHAIKIGVKTPDNYIQELPKMKAVLDHMQKAKLDVRLYSREE